jgi:hypothetical protein
MPQWSSEFHGIFVIFPFSSLNLLIWVFSFFLLVSVTKVFSTLLIISKSQLFDPLILCIVLLVIILLICVLIFITTFLLLLLVLACPYVSKSLRLFIWNFSDFLMKALIAINFPLNSAFAVSQRFWLIVFALSFASKNFFYFPPYIFSDPLTSRMSCSVSFVEYFL